MYVSPLLISEFSSMVYGTQLNFGKRYKDNLRVIFDQWPNFCHFFAFFYTFSARYSHSGIKFEFSEQFQSIKDFI